jgi:hypothetical protein
MVSQCDSPKRQQPALADPANNGPRNFLAGLYFCRAMQLMGSLQANFEEAEQSLEKSRQGWDQYGVTIMCDSWMGHTGMAIINFMVSCNGRMFFHKSIDASSCKQSAGKCSCTKCNCHLSSSFT